MFEAYWSLQRKPCRAADVVACVMPSLLLILLAAIYMAAPSFYLKYILEYRQREYQAVELATFAFGLIGAAALGWSTLQAWRITTGARQAGLIPYRTGLAGALDGRGGVFVIAVVFLATFFLTGEEINWGQTFIHWGAPMTFKSKATNVHNNLPISVQGLGTFFLMVIFVGMPILWALRRRLPVPADWAPAVAECPVIAAILIAFIPAELKDQYLDNVTNARSTTLYIEYFEQLKEQKEMLVAFSLMLYGLYRIKAVRNLRLAASASQATAGAAIASS